MPFFSILIVLFNNEFDIIEKNLQNLAFDDYEVIMIDNTENDVYFDKLKQWTLKLPPETRRKIILHQAPFNGGYTRGNNIAFTKSSGNYLLILNPDMELGPNFLGLAENIIKRKPWKIICPKTYYDFTSKIFQSTFFRLRKYTILHTFNPIGLNQKDIGQFNAYYESFYASGGCFLIARDLFKELHGFDERYFMYNEDTDICFRAKLRNIITVFCPQLSAAHLRKGDSPLAIKFMLKNTLIFYGKYFSFLSLLIQFIFSFIRLFVKSYERKKNEYHYERFFPYLRSTCNGFVEGWKYHLLN